jgi:RNA polymerase sigma-70 factor (ECF subfamily)
MIKRTMVGVSVHELESLYRLRYAHFVRVASALLRNEDQAVDAVQDAFVTAIRSRRTYRGEGSIEAWVWRIVVNSARRELSRRTHARSHDLIRSGSDQESRPIRTAILRLPERQRLVLFLRYYADLDYASIATALSIRPGTVGATLNAAHASLRTSLEEVRS